MPIKIRCTRNHWSAGESHGLWQFPDDSRSNFRIELESGTTGFMHRRAEAAIPRSAQSMIFEPSDFERAMPSFICCSRAGG